jgi:hypothetical protein
MVNKIQLLILVILVALVSSCSSDFSNSSPVDRLPVIFPDYSGIVIPPNIAPLNFAIKEKGKDFAVRISSSGQDPITVQNSRGIIEIGIGKWHDLLKKTKGKEINIEVFVKNENGNWQKFKTIVNKVANEEIDNHLAYRLINTGYVLWSAIGIYQRNLENFDESPIIDNKSIDNTCINCHSFARNSPKSMMVHVRSTHGGTVIYENGKLRKVNLKTKYTLNQGAYVNLHPDGRHLVYSVNTISQRFFSKDIRQEVSDAASDLIVYDVEKNIVTTSPKVSTRSRENMPVWSADGKSIYYISAPEVTDYNSQYNAKFSLMRIPYDVDKNVWGQADTVISAHKTGKSVTFPKTSPDGKYLMFTLTDHGYFSIHHPDADLYLLNLQTGQFERMDVNSNMTDSYHCWSSSGRWFVFSSKRIDGLYTRPFFCYFDQNGKASKPFVLPQKDPEFYDSFLNNYNIPELITGAVEPSAFDIRDVILTDAKPADLDPTVDTRYMEQLLRKKEETVKPAATEEH